MWLDEAWLIASATRDWKRRRSCRARVTDLIRDADARWKILAHSQPGAPAGASGMEGRPVAI